MSILWKPHGSLNVATAPSDLPESGNGTDTVSEDFSQAKNIRVDRIGLAELRYGSSNINASAIATTLHLLIEQSGNRYSFAGTSIYKNESSIASPLTSRQWTALQYNAINDLDLQIYATNGVDRKRINDTTIAEWGVDAPTVAPTLSTGAGSGLTGAYNSRYTYAIESDGILVLESNPSPVAASPITLSDDSLTVSFTAPSDPAVTHIRIYRTTTGGATYLFDQKIAVNTLYNFGYAFDWEKTDAYISGTGYKYTVADSTNGTENTTTWEQTHKITTDTDSTSQYTMPFNNIDSFTPDASLGAALETDHARIPINVSYVLGPSFNGTCFAIKDNLLHYSKAKQPEYWPADYFIEVSVRQHPGVIILFHNGQVYFLTKYEIFYIQGSTHGTFFPLPMQAKTGAQGVFGAISVHGHGVYHTGTDGLYLYSGNDRKITLSSFEPIFHGEAAGNVPAVSDVLATAWLQVFKNKLYFGYTSSGNSYPTNLLVMQLDDPRRITYYNYAFQIRNATVDKINNRLLAACADGIIRVLEDESVTTDAGTAIAWTSRSKDFTLQTRKHFPRWAKWDVDATNSVSCIGAIILDGVSHQSHTITGNRQTQRRLVGPGNGNRCALQLSGTGPVKFYAAEME